MFKRATRKQARLRIGLLGTAGCGKTFSALRIGSELVPEHARDPKKNKGRAGIAFIDTETGSAALYAEETNPDGGAFEFDVVDLAQERGKFSVENYLKAIKAAASAGYPVLIIDSLSHAWAGAGGLLEYKDKLAAKSSSGNSWTAWREVTPLHNALIDAILSYPGDVLVTMRVKMEHVQEQVRGKTVIRKVGLQPVQRDGLEYEFTVILDIELESHKAVVSKTRCSRIADETYVKPGKDLAAVLVEWRDQGGNWHDDDWTEEQGKFFAALKELGVDYDDAIAFWIAEFPKRSHLRPSQIGRDGRKELYRALVKRAKDAEEAGDEPKTKPKGKKAAPADDSERQPGEEG